MMANIADTPSPIEEDTLALYNAVSKGNGTSMVQAYSQAARSAIVASSIKRQTAPFVWTGDRHHARSPGYAEEKTDEFFTHRNTSGIFRLEDDMSRVRSSSPSWIRHYTQTSSFSLGNYYMQNLMHHPWASSSINDCRVSLVSLDTVLNKCQGGEKQPHIPHVKSCPASMGRAAANEKMVFDSNRLAFRKIPPPSEMLDEDIRFLAKVLSNSRPPIEFVYSADEAAEARNRNDTQHAFRRQQQEASALFDGAHGAANGTLLHLACIVDSPLAAALLLVFGGDPSMRHTAFRRLPIHEAACCGSTQCLTLLLELSDALEHSMNQEAGLFGVSMMLAANKDQDAMVYSSASPTQGTNSESTRSVPALVLEDPQVYGQRSFAETLDFVLELQSQVDCGKLMELEAARVLLRTMGIPHSVRQAYAGTIPIATATDGHGNTALHWASFKNEVGAVQVLLKHGADANFRANHSGWTPLHDAAYSDSAEAVALLLEAGASLDARSNSGATPLCFAAQEDSPNALEYLLKAGADPGVQCCGHSASSNLHERTNTIGLILDDAAQRVQTFVPSRFSGYTPLHYCAHYNAYEAAKVLLKYGAPIESEDLSHRRPIHVAVARGSAEVLRQLLKAGARVETTQLSMGRSQCQLSTSPASPASPLRPTSVPSSAPSRLENTFRLFSPVDGRHLMIPFIMDVQHPQGRMLPGNPFGVPVGIPTMPFLQAPDNMAVSPSSSISSVSSPVLKAMIPIRPVQSSKPWNCLTQRAIDECNYLISAAEGHWSPETHNQVFSPADRRAVLELLRVGKRLEQQNTGIFLDLWPIVLSFCGRGWFEPGQVDTVERGNNANDLSYTARASDPDHEMEYTEEDRKPSAQQVRSNPYEERGDFRRNNQADYSFIQFDLEADDYQEEMEDSGNADSIN